MPASSSLSRLKNAITAWVSTLRVFHLRRPRLRLRTLAKGWPFYGESAPVSPDETLLRAIPNTPDYFSEHMGAWAVDPYAFKPNKKRDLDGMSFFREDFTTVDAVARNNRHPQGARVARVTLAQFQELNLEVIPNPDEGEPARPRNCSRHEVR